MTHGRGGCIRRARPGFAPAIVGVLAGMLAGSCLAAAPIDVLRDCAAKAPPELSGIKPLAERCPQLEDALKALGLEETLYDGWREHLNRDGLQDLANLTDAYGATPPPDRPDLKALPAILQALSREQGANSPSWWEAFKAWLRTWLGSHSDSLSWLDRWLERLGGSLTLTKVISYSLVALVLLAAAAVIVNEFKAVGRVRAPRDASRAGARMPAADPSAAGPEPAALADRLAALLRRLVERLVQTRRLESERSLTHRELVARSVFDIDAQRAVFARVARTAEAVLYGPSSGGPSGGAPDQLAAVLEEGRGLLAQLSAPPPASGAR
jgi:hypothetical protein